MTDADEAGARVERGVLLQVAYDGAAFHGWASQRDARTVQDTLKGALLALDPTIAEVRGTSRTDAGVHARAQMVAFDTTRDIPPRGWVLGTNQHLPDDVAVRAAREVPAGFSPRFASRGKRYEYTLSLDPVRDPLARGRAWRVGSPLDLDAVRAEAEALVGTHDFAAYRAAKDERTDTTRTVTAIGVELPDPSRVVLAFEGTAFLYNMVRIMVGTLVDIGTGRLPRGRAGEALASRDRRLSGQTAPPEGLVLARIDLDLPGEAGEPWPR